MSQFTTDLEVLRSGVSVRRSEFPAEELPQTSDLTAIPESLWIPSRTPGFDRLTEWSLDERSSDASMQKVYVALKSIASTLIDSARSRNLQVNRYHPSCEGAWHIDFHRLLPTFVLGLTEIEDPSFEYAKQVVRDHEGKIIPGDDVGSTTILPGDSLIIEAPDFMHRGLNPTADFRYSAAMPSWGHPLGK